MNNSVRDFLSQRAKQHHATNAGTNAHARMQFITIDDGIETGAPDIITKIKANPDILKFFTSSSRVEVPIAGKINGKLNSRRIDRMLVNNSDKTVCFLDYKTDTDKNVFRDKYIVQLREYSQLLGQIYPGYRIRGFILWLGDFSLEEIV